MISNTRYVERPCFKKHVNQWAKNNGMAIGGNDGRGNKSKTDNIFIMSSRTMAMK